MNPAKFPYLDTFQLAHAAALKLSNLRQKSTPNGRKYFVDLEGVTMLASEARKKLEAHILGTGEIRAMRRQTIKTASCLNCGAKNIVPVKSEAT